MQSHRRHRILPGRSWCDHRSRLVPISRSSRISVSGFDCTQVSVLWVTYMSTDATRWKVQVLNDSRLCISPWRNWCDYRSCHVLISRLSKISASGLDLRTSAGSLSHTRINSFNKMRGQVQYDSRHCILPIEEFVWSYILSCPDLQIFKNTCERVRREDQCTSSDSHMDEELQQDGKECNMTEGTAFHLKKFCVMINKVFSR